MNGVCANCDEQGLVHRHHPNKKRWPDFTIPLCYECHSDTHHMPLVFFRPGACEEFKEWLERQEAGRKYVPLREVMAKYKEIEFDERGQHRWW